MTACRATRLATESEHDWVENSHASTSLSYVDGLAKAFAVRGEKRTVVAVVGDGALTGGMCWEALNNIAAAKDRSVVVLVNDNGRSYSQTIGGLAEHLTTLRTNPRYEKALEKVKEVLGRTPLVGDPLFDALHGIKRGLKDVLTPQGLFEDLGLKYVGPIDGHDIPAIEAALAKAKRFGGPVIVHCVTRKGFGYGPAEDDELDHLHGPGAFDPLTGVELPKPASWTGTFSDEIVKLAAVRPDIVAITAAMLHPVGLAAFADAYPDRIVDVGIAEQHAVTSAAGMAMGGLHPMVCVYATFLNRAFDQMLLDVGLHRLPVTFVLDRAGVTGDDGPSHNGMWDLSILSMVPGMRIALPRDGARLRELLDEVVAIDDGPTAIRFPKGALPRDIERVDRIGTVDVLRADADARRADRGVRSDGRAGPRRLDSARRSGHRLDRRRPAVAAADRSRHRQPGGVPFACCCRSKTMAGKVARARRSAWRCAMPALRPRCWCSRFRNVFLPRASAPKCWPRSASPLRKSRDRWSNRWPASNATSRGYSLTSERDRSVALESRAASRVSGTERR